MSALGLADELGQASRRPPLCLVSCGSAFSARRVSLFGQPAYRPGRAAQAIQLLLLPGTAPLPAVACWSKLGPAGSASPSADRHSASLSARSPHFLGGAAVAVRAARWLSSVAFFFCPTSPVNGRVSGTGRAFLFGATLGVFMAWSVVGIYRRDARRLKCRAPRACSPSLFLMAYCDGSSTARIQLAGGVSGWAWLIFPFLRCARSPISRFFPLDPITGRSLIAGLGRRSVRAEFRHAWVLPLAACCGRLIS